MNLRKMVPGDVEQVAAVHERALPWSINGRLGRSHLEGLYERLTGGPDFVGYVALHHDEVVAFQVSSTDWRAARHRLANVDMARKASVALTCLAHPLDLVALFESVFVIPRVFARSAIRAEIIAWAATPNDPIAVVGAHRCIMSSMAELVARGERMCLAQMQKPNRRPMAYLNRLQPRTIARLVRNDVLAIDCERATATVPPVRVS